MNVRENQKNAVNPYTVWHTCTSVQQLSRKNDEAARLSLGFFHMPKFEACELSRKDFVENHHVFKSQHLCKKDLVLGMPTGVDAGFVRHMHIGVALTSLSWECWNVLENCSNPLGPETIHLEIHGPNSCDVFTW